jgi:transcriptional regulator with XRE-family HTH domain
MRLPIDDIDLQLARKIKEIRKLKGWSQEELGTQLNLSYQQIQKYETSHNKIRVSTLYKMAEVFHVPVSYFLEDLYGKENKKVYKFNATVLKTMALLQNLPNEIQESIYAFCKKLTTLL